MVVVTGTVLIAGGLIVGGLAAAGWLAQQIGGALNSAGRQTQFNTVDEVSDSLRNIGRPDLAQELNLEVARGNTAAFNLQQTQIEASPVQQLVDLAPLAILGFLAVKLVK